MAKPACAQSIPTPSVPTFTLKLVGPPYVMNTTYSLDPNTGQIVAKIGYTNPYSGLAIDVKNQNFDGGFTYANLYYNVRVKDHNATDNWVNAYEGWNYYPQQSNSSDYTDVGFSIEGANFVGTIAGSQVDIQVEAMYGYYGRTSTAFGGQGFVNLTTSDWSNTQTISIPANTPLSTTSTPPSSTSTLTPTPTLTSVSSTSYASLLLITTIALVVIAFLLAIIISLILYMRKRRIGFSQTKVTQPLEIAKLE